MNEKKQPWFETSYPLRMFPTFVWKAELKREIRQRINVTILGKLDELRRCSPALESGQVWQSNQDLQKLDEFRELISCVDGVAATVLEFLKIGYETFEVSACWANAGATGSGHRAHSHPNNFLSGVYYVKTRDGANTINFHDPRPQTGIIRPPVTKLTAENTDQVVVKVDNGTLLVFPSWLQHSVDTNQSKQERISVSFNMMFSSYTERMSKPLW